MGGVRTKRKWRLARTRSKSIFAGSKASLWCLLRNLIQTSTHIVFVSLHVCTRRDGGEKKGGKKKGGKKKPTNPK